MIINFAFASKGLELKALKQHLKIFLSSFVVEEIEAQVRHADMVILEL